ncbi:hypothetical protein N7471_010353 [Penicillium samsonianum]|uniref:uncharacterized protein n=1 Tax=Penicillium samsonianum TaxID=1882272 RepID=UPI002547C91E|nr:uncharacterized protein N7471_010353 [Penicillium samsonianum]KAJ6125860.1 hypothetical protein N7471_010353 [Penicillium samsonianum]
MGLGYGDPSDGEIEKIYLSIEHVLDTLDRDGPFVGIVGFSSGAAMAAIITSLLEKKPNICDITWKPRCGLKRMREIDQSSPLGASSQPQLFCLSQRVHIRTTVYTPLISTPMLIAVGSHDPVVLPTQTRNLASQCQNESTMSRKVKNFRGFAYPRPVFGRCAGTSTNGATSIIGR